MLILTIRSLNVWYSLEGVRDAVLPTSGQYHAIAQRNSYQSVKDDNVMSFTEHLREELMINFGLHSAGNTGEISDSIDHELSARMLIPREPVLK